MAAGRLDQMEKKENEDKSMEVAKVDPEKLIKHPLQNTWTLWYFKMDANLSWEECQMEVATVNSVEDFWAVYNHIELASHLNVGCDYSLFKQGIMPMWEDEQNWQGGRWLININKHKRSTEVDQFWLKVCLLMIGEVFGKYSDDVNGAVISPRTRGDKLGIWTSTVTDSESIMKIGRTLKERLGIPRHFKIGFQAHTDSMAKTGSAVADRYTV